MSLTRSVHITGNGDGVRAIQISLVHCAISVVTPEQQTHPVHETANNNQRLRRVYPDEISGQCTLAQLSGYITLPTLFLRFTAQSEKQFSDMV